jgi:hypothetical protein
VTTATKSPSLRRRWGRFVLRTQGLLDGTQADRVIPWVATAGLFGALLALNAAAIRSLDGGSGLGPWVQAAWRRRNGGAGQPVGGVDPAQASWSLVSEPILRLTRFVPPEAIFSAVQAGAIALAVVPLWRLARTEAHLRVGAAIVVLVAFALAPTIHRTNLSAFHPEVIALPALLWAYLHARQAHWKRYGALVVLVLACRADLGLTVVALGLVLASRGRRHPGLVTAAGGLIWTAAAVAILGPATPGESLTPAGEFVARSTSPLAVVPRLVTQPITEIGELLTEPSVAFLVVVLAPLLFLPLVATRKLLVAMPCLVLAIVADRAVQRVAERGVLDLSPAAAHVAPALSFVFVALVFALQRVGETSVTRVNVDRRVLFALLAGVTLFFVAEAPTSPYRQPWDWGSRDAPAGAMMEAGNLVGSDDAVAVSPAATAVVANRGRLVELPPDPVDLTAARIAEVARWADAVLLDTSDARSDTSKPLWTTSGRRTVLNRFADWSFDVTYEGAGVYLLERP